MKKVLAVFCTFVFVGVVMAEEFTLQVTKINDDGTVTGNKKAVGKGGKGGGGGGVFGKGDEATVKIAKDVKVYKGKFDAEAKGMVKDGEELGGLTGLKAAFKNADKVNISVDGTALTDKDKLEIAVVDGKPAVKLNGKDVDINKVTWRGKTPLATRVTTDDEGTITHVLLTGGGGGNKGGKGKGGANKGGGN